jgi:AAA domain
VKAEIKSIIEAKYKAQLVFAKNDVLVQLKADQQITIERQLVSFGETASIFIDKNVGNKHIKAASISLKTHGVNTLCLVLGTIFWKNLGQQSPFLLVPVTIKQPKNSPLIGLELLWENVFLNPYLETEFPAISSLELPTSTAEHATFCKEWSKHLLEINFDGSIENDSFIANAHPDRFDRLRDLRLLCEAENYSTAVKALLGFTPPLETINQTIEQTVLPTDPSQKQALRSIQNNNLALVGPPGTGKSQVIVNTIALALTQNQNILVVSEKLVALEVIQKRMTQLELHHFCHLFEPFKTNTHFIHSLKKTWYHLENLPRQNTLHFSQSHLLKSNLQATLEQLQHPTFAMGVDYEQYLNLTKTATNTDATTFSPDLKTWLEVENHIEEIYSLKINKLLWKISPALLQNKNHYKDTFTRIKKLIDKTAAIKNFEVLNLKSIDESARLSSLCAHYLSHEISIDKSIFTSSSTAQKKFLSLRKKLKKITLEITQHVNEIDSCSSIQQSFALQFTPKKGLTKILQDTKIKKIFGSTHKLQQLLTILLSKSEKEKYRNELQIALLTLGIDNEISSESVYFFINMVNNDASREQFFALSDHQKKEIAQQSQLINHIRNELPRIYTLTDQQLFGTLLVESHQLFETIIKKDLDLSFITTDLLHVFSISPTFTGFKKTVLATNKTQFERRFPHLQHWDEKHLMAKISEIKRQLTIDNQHNIQTLVESHRSQFNQLTQKLLHPTAQLSSDEKAEKQRLRRGKAILVKEFAKTRNHLSLKSLLTSDAYEWIKVLKPVILGNPSHIATQLPEGANVFDLGCIDEGSQLLLAHSLPVIQRCKKVMIAGDPQQMSPSFFFQKSTDEVDVLHQAFHYFKKETLQYHYRSEHPALVAFSNHFFYNNKLVPIKKAGPNFPIKLIYCADGQYIDRKNIPEAKQIAESLHYNKIKESIGLVAFSEVQLDCILHELNQNGVTLFDDAQTNNFARTLEQVQGDECDHLYISLGYGKNEEGTMKLLFGTLNQQNGSRRLNVLFSRAKKSITLFHSMKAAELSISKNEGINMLRWYLTRYQNENTDLTDVQQKINRWNVEELLLLE